MKKSLPILLLALFWVNSLMAGVVTEKQALQKAQKFMKGKSFVVADSRAMSRSKAADETSSFYVFNAENQGGFVIVSGDDRTPEILGYADNGEMDMENLPSNVKAWLDGYDRQIKSLGNRQVKPLTSTPRTAIEPLIKTQWNQHKPYNLQCPTVDGKHCLTGCTATAIAQIMYYWKTPTTVTPALPSYDVRKWNEDTYAYEFPFTVPALEPTTFKWDLMRTTYNYSDADDGAQAVAELMRYVGQSQEMSYGLDASAAHPYGRWISNFGYNNRAATWIYRDSYSSAAWEEVIYTELVAKRPVLYVGYPIEGIGHTFICDGYDGNGRFHINWGWGGSCDGHYLLNVLNDDPSGVGPEEAGTDLSQGYNAKQGAYIGVQPAEGNENVYFTSDSPEGVSVQYLITSNTDGERTCQVNGNDESAISTEYEGTLTIPSTVTYEGKEYQVNSIGANAFRNCQFIAISLPITLTEIKSSAFAYNSKLASFELPASVVTLGNSLFQGCGGIEALTVASGNTKYSSPNNCNAIIENSTNTLLVGCKNTVVPENVTAIAAYALYNCSGLSSVTIPDGVTSIGNYAFYYCRGLKSVISEIKHPFAIHASVFASLSSDAVLYVPIGCKSLYEAIDGWKDAFSQIVESGEEFQSVVSNVPVWFTVTGENIVKVGRKGSSAENLAIDASTTGAIDLPETVEHDGKVYRITEIGSYAFYNCSELTSVTIPNGVTSIGDYAFSGCSSLASVTIPDGVTSIGDYAFYYCTSLTSVIISEGVTSIGNYAFFYCRGLSSVLIPNSVTCIGNWAFAYCYGLTSVTIPSSVTSIGNSAFAYCYSLKDVSSKIMTPFAIDASVFRNISSDVTLYVPFGCKSHYMTTDGWKDAFSKIAEGGEEFQSVVSYVQVWFTVTGENTVKVGRKVGSSTNLAIYASTTGLINLPETIEHDGKAYRITEIGSYAFYNCTKLTSVTIPNSVTSIGNSAFYNCSGLTSVSIPDGVTSIGNYAFAYCYSLKEVSSEIMIPFAIDASVFRNLSSDAVLYVSSSKSLYEATDGWRDSFSKIVDEREEFLANDVARVPVWFTITGKNTVKVGRLEGSQEKLAVEAVEERLWLELPETVEHNGTVYKVTGIGTYAFYAMHYVHVEIPQSVAYIDKYVFANCEWCDFEVSWMNPITVDETAFLNVSDNPNSLWVPSFSSDKYRSAVGWSENHIFESNTFQFEIQDGIKAWFYRTGDNTVAFRTTGAICVPAVDKSLFGRRPAVYTSLTVPESITIEEHNLKLAITEVGDWAFYFLEGLETVTLPSTIEKIGRSAFDFCYSIGSIVIPKKVTSIGESAFSYCRNLKDVYSEIETPFAIDASVFEGISSDAVLHVPFGCKALYEVADGWKSSFSQIVEEKEVETVEFQSDVSNVPVWFAINGENTVKVGRLLGSDENIAIDASTAGTIDLPETVVHNGKEYRITEIGSYAFYNCSSLASVTIPNGVTALEDYCFYGANIASLTLPSMLESIGEGAIASNRLKELVIPASVTSIAPMAIGMCSNLSSLSVAEGNKTYDSRGGISAVIETKTNRLVVGTSKLTTVPSSVTAIGDYAFYYYNLVNLTIPESVTAIGYRAFACCSNSAITIPKSVTTINNYAFARCSNSVITVLRDDPLDISENVFYDCGTRNVTLRVPAGSKEKYKSATGWNVFDENFLEEGNVGTEFTATVSGLEVTFTVTGENTVKVGRKEGSSTNLAIDESSTGLIDLPETVGHDGKEYRITEIGSYAFNNCRGLTSVTIPSSVTSIGNRAFSGCGGLSSVSIPNSIISIGGAAFMGCYGLTSVTIPSSVTSILGYAFQNCTRLKDVNSEIKNPFAIDASVFRNLSSDVTLYVPSGCKSLYEATDGWKDAFLKIAEGGEEFQSVVSNIPVWFTVTGENNVKVGRKVGSAENLAIDANTTGAIDLPETIDHDGKVYRITEIGSYAFCNCRVLTSVTIPNGVTSIGNDAFLYCRGLSSVPIPNSVTSIGNWAFAHCYGLISVTIHSGVTSIGVYAFCRSGSLKDVTSKIKNPFAIDVTAFSELSSDVTLYVPSGCKALYEETDGWKDAFSQIVEMSSGIVANDVTYEVKEDNTVEVKTAEVNKTTGSVSIAQKVVVNNEAVTVTAIAPKAFQNVEAVKSVTIPATVKSIGELAFAGCKNLKEVLCLNPDPVNLSVAAARGLLKDGESGGTVSQFDGVDLKGCTLYVLTAAENDYRNAQGWNSFGTIKPFAGMGDVNTDKAIDVSDVVGEVNQILGKASDGFLYGAGDMNADNSIDVSDVVSIVNVILGKTAAARSMERLSAVAEATATDHLSLMSGNEGGLSLVLDNTADYIAAQFDVRLSEGQTLEKVVKGQRARGHQLATAKMSDGVYRVLLYTIGDRTFSGQSGEVVSLGVAGQGDVTVENITFITAGENRKKFDDLSNQLTGIDAVLNDNGEMLNDKTVWHDLQGRKLEAAPTTKGVYLKNGKKVVVK